jgi:hypothetical protein
MRSIIQSLGLLFVVLAAQQGAVVHELSHAPRIVRADLQMQSAESADSACTLCPAYAQAATPAFSHSFAVPLGVRSTSQRILDHADAAIDAAIPSPRSRGPPASS